MTNVGYGFRNYLSKLTIIWPKLLNDLVFLRSKTQSFPWKNIDSNTHMGCGEGGEGGSGESPESSYPLPESVTEDFTTKIVKRRFHFS